MFWYIFLSSDSHVSVSNFCSVCDICPLMPRFSFLSSCSLHNVQVCILKNPIAYGRIKLRLCFQNGCSSRKYGTAQPRKQGMTFGEGSVFLLWGKRELWTSFPRNDQYLSFYQPAPDRRCHGTCLDALLWGKSYHCLPAASGKLLFWRNRNRFRYGWDSGRF